MKRFLIIICCLLFVSYSVAQTFKVDKTVHDGETYDVTTDETFENVNIESDGVLTVKSGATLTVTGTLTSPDVTCLIIEEGGQLVYDLKAKASVKATLEKEIKAYDINGWYAISKPIIITKKGINETELVKNNGDSGTDFDLYYYKEDEYKWISHKQHSSDDLFAKEKTKKCVGYLYASKQTKVYRLAGDIVTDNCESISLTANGEKLTGFNLIGNPYTHNVYKGYDDEDNPCAIANPILASGFYSLENGSWKTETKTRPIKPCEAILVKVTSNGNINIENSIVVATKDNVSSAKIERKELGITINGNNGEDITYAYFYNGIGLDKIDHLSEAVPSLSIRYEDTDYAIAHVDENSNMLDVIFKNNQSGFFTLSVNNEKANFNYLHLIDNLTGEDIDMLAEKSYKFYALGNEDENRFKIVLNPNTDSADASTFAYVFNDDIIITGVEGCATLQVFDVMGRLVNSEIVSGTSGSICRVNKPNSAGVYVLRLIENNNVNAQRIVVE